MTSVLPEARTNSTQSVALAPPKTFLMTSRDHGRRDGGVSSHDFVRGCPAQAAVQAFFLLPSSSHVPTHTHGLAACISIFARQVLTLQGHTALSQKICKLSLRVDVLWQHRQVR